MVYRGKPSKGCQNCRERKIRCDQQEPSCHNCTKTQRQCPGYRDQLDLMFQNENEEVIRKAKGRELPKTKQVSSTSSRSGPVQSPAGAIERNESFPSPTTIHNLAPTTEERAMCFFTSNLAISVFGPAQDYLSYLPLLSARNTMDAHLSMSIRAVGLAGYSNVANSPELMKHARRDYTTALQLVNAALRSPSDVQKDSTLLAVMILSVFETITGVCRRSLQAWAKHIAGAAALVKLRGPGQLLSRDGFRLFNHVTANLLMSCVHRELAIPQDILELRAEAARCVDARLEAAWRLQDILIAFAGFRAGLRDGSLSDLKVVLAAAVDLDGAFLDFFSGGKIPDFWKYSVVLTKDSNTNVDPDLVVDGASAYHVYRDFGIAQIWNSMRSCRILLNRTIRDTLLSGFAAKPPVFVSPEHTALFQGATDALFQLQADILASVPQYFARGDIASVVLEPLDTPSPSVAPFGGSSNRPSSQFPDQRPRARASGAYFILWPLYLVGSIDTTTEPVRLWLIKRLQFIGRSEGIQLAVALASLLEQKGKIQAWWSKSQS